MNNNFNKKKKGINQIKILKLEKILLKFILFY